MADNTEPDTSPREIILEDEAEEIELRDALVRGNDETNDDQSYKSVGQTDSDNDSDDIDGSGDESDDGSEDSYTEEGMGLDLDELLSTYFADVEGRTIVSMMKEQQLLNNNMNQNMTQMFSDNFASLNTLVSEQNGLLKQQNDCLMTHLTKQNNIMERMLKAYKMSNMKEISESTRKLKSKRNMSEKTSEFVDLDESKEDIMLNEQNTNIDNVMDNNGVLYSGQDALVEVNSEISSDISSELAKPVPVDVSTSPVDININS